MMGKEAKRLQVSPERGSVGCFGMIDCFGPQMASIEPMYPRTDMLFTLARQIKHSAARVPPASCFRSAPTSPLHASCHGEASAEAF